MELNLLVMWEEMGFMARLVVIALVLMGIFMIAISLERWRTYRRGRLASTAFVKAIHDCLDKRGSDSIPTFQKLCAESALGPIQHVVAAAAHAFTRKSDQLETLDVVVGINRAIERSIERQTDHLKKYLGALATIASVAPFVGLLGTVVGIINAFTSMAESGSGGLASVSGGIAEALVATALGLFVAIPAVGLYNYFNGIVEGFVVDMGEIASEVVEAVVLTPRVKS